MKRLNYLDRAFNAVYYIQIFYYYYSKIAINELKNAQIIILFSNAIIIIVFSFKMIYKNKYRVILIVEKMLFVFGLMITYICFFDEKYNNTLFNLIVSTLLFFKIVVECIAYKGRND